MGLVQGLSRLVSGGDSSPSAQTAVLAGPNSEQYAGSLRPSPGVKTRPTGALARAGLRAAQGASWSAASFTSRNETRIRLRMEWPHGRNERDACEISGALPARVRVKTG